MRIVGPATLAAFAGRMVNVHPSLLPAFPGANAVHDALAAGVKTTGVTVHLVDEKLDGGPILLQEPVTILPGDDEASLLARIHAVEHRLLAQAILLVGAADPADAMLPAKRALLSVSDKTGLVEFATGLSDLGYEVVSTGGTASALRGAGLEVTDVAALSGAGEMLDGRVKTLHPRIHGGILADRTKASHRAQLAAAAIAPFDLVVVNLYPFAAAADRPERQSRRAGRGDRHRRAGDGPGIGQELRVGGGRDVACPLWRRSWCAARGRLRAVAAAGGPRRRSVPSRCRLRRTHRRRAPAADGGGDRPARRARPARRRRSIPGHATARVREGRNAALRREPAPGGGAVPTAWHACEPRPVRPRRPTAAGQSAQLQQRPRHVGGGGTGCATCAGLRAPSSNTPIRAAPPNGRICSPRGRRHSPATR